MASPGVRAFDYFQIIGKISQREVIWPRYLIIHFGLGLDVSFDYSSNAIGSRDRPDDGYTIDRSSAVASA
jgi:hypothetical protein